jgi:hypothetical protein
MKVELVAMEHMASELFEDLHESRMAHKQVSFSTTAVGRLVNATGYFFSGYCVYKMFMACINIVFNRVAQVRPAEVLGVCFAACTCMALGSAPNSALFLHPSRVSPCALLLRLRVCLLLPCRCGIRSRQCSAPTRGSIHVVFWRVPCLDVCCRLAAGDP